jgi:hypothetical protein
MQRLSLRKIAIARLRGRPGYTIRFLPSVHKHRHAALWTQCNRRTEFQGVARRQFQSIARRHGCQNEHGRPGLLGASGERMGAVCGTVSCEARPNDMTVKGAAALLNYPRARLIFFPLP